ncbi:hypothetical protein CBR_g40695 [Chara braunii]|uniref:Uncharacterized protein n=1 Tax=Chara braunii TaxID=69332 RepID=A0A388LUG5_CHABU|nr:hypothetical protein CBR_g40695 [Chara braunii]|eukprot:GBG85883.1 hypothetical protein CBR_g40695 [Chara braunii]
MKSVRCSHSLRAVEVEDTGEMASQPVIGIDLGTSFCCVAIYRDNKVEIVPNKVGPRITPSYVAFDARSCYTGEAAMMRAARDPKQGVFEVKRLMGRSIHHPNVEEYKKAWPFEVVAGPRNGVRIKIPRVPSKFGAGLFKPEEISTILLREMKEIAETFAGELPIRDAVITVPAYFNNSQREATMDAGRGAGLNVLRLMNEPTAAAVAYRHQRLIGEGGAGRKIMVFDLGGGTFDVSIMAVDGSCAEGGFVVKAVEGCSDLGGADFDNRLVSRVAAEYRRQNDRDLLADPRILPILREKAVMAKHILSDAADTVIELYCRSIDFTMRIDRCEFEALNDDLFEKCISTVKKALQAAGLTKHEISEVVLVGGSTRIPRVQELLTKFFDGRKPIKTVHPDEVVAYGAALQAAVLSDQVRAEDKPDIAVHDVTAMSIGVLVHPGEFRVLIPKNSRIEATAEIEGICSKDYQTSVEFKLYEGERALCRQNRFLGDFKLEGFTPSPANGRPVMKLVLKVDYDGILDATAHATADHEERGRTVGLRVSVGQGTFNKEGADAVANAASDANAEEEDKAMRAVFQARRDLRTLLWDLRDSYFARLCRFERDRVTTLLRWLAAEEDYAAAAAYERYTIELTNVKTALISCVRVDLGAVHLCCAVGKICFRQVSKSCICLDGDGVNVIERVKQPKLVVISAADAFNPPECLDRGLGISQVLCFLSFRVMGFYCEDILGGRLAIVKSSTSSCLYIAINSFPMSLWYCLRPPGPGFATTAFLPSLTRLNPRPGGVPSRTAERLPDMRLTVPATEANMSARGPVHLPEAGVWTAEVPGLSWAWAILRVTGLLVPPVLGSRKTTPLALLLLAGPVGGGEGGREGEGGGGGGGDGGGESPREEGPGGAAAVAGTGCSGGGRRVHPPLLTCTSCCIAGAGSARGAEGGNILAFRGGCF